MGYCTIQDVRDLTNTSLADVDVTRFIAKADRWINTRLVEESISTSFGTVPDNILEASSFKAASLVLNKHMIDGTLPETFDISGAKASIDVVTVIRDYKDQAESFLERYINQNVSFSPYRVVGRDGERVGEYAAMTKDQELED